VSRETTAAKARRYLAEGRLTVVRVVGDIVDAVIEADTGTYQLGRDPGRGWHCSCDAHGRCSHVGALKLVTVRRPGGGDAA
jgi:hypothetical protein